MKSALRYLLCENTIIYPCLWLVMAYYFAEQINSENDGTIADEYEAKTNCVVI